MGRTTPGIKNRPHIERIPFDVVHISRSICYPSLSFSTERNLPLHPAAQPLYTQVWPSLGSFTLTGDSLPSFLQL